MWSQFVVKIFEMNDHIYWKWIICLKECNNKNLGHMFFFDIHCLFGCEIDQFFSFWWWDGENFNEQ